LQERDQLVDGVTFRRHVRERHGRRFGDLASGRSGAGAGAARAVYHRNTLFELTDTLHVGIDALGVYCA
jgi:hypothetical protein